MDFFVADGDEKKQGLKTENLKPEMDVLRCGIVLHLRFNVSGFRSLIFYARHKENGRAKARQGHDGALVTAVLPTRDPPRRLTSDSLIPTTTIGRLPDGGQSPPPRRAT